MRTTKKQIANNTLNIIEHGIYQYKDSTIQVGPQIQASVDSSFAIHPDQWNEIVVNAPQEYHTKIEVLSGTTMEAFLNKDHDHKTAVLNFASAKNPGGGFLGGASAQEESLARSSSLYASLIKHKEMYKYNRERSTFLYSDYMIYSPNVVFWFDDAGNALELPVTVDVLTSPAPNKGTMLQHKREDELAALDEVFKNRIEKALRLAQQQNVKCLILGAWGCGVFRNEPTTVAQLFKEVIQESFPKAFKQIVFAIYNSSKKKDNLTVFEQILKNTVS